MSVGSSVAAAEEDVDDEDADVRLALPGTTNSINFPHASCPRRSIDDLITSRPGYVSAML